MTDTDFQLGGAYVYQWECATLFALNYLLDSPLEFRREMHQLIDEFLGHVEAIHLEGETRDEDDVDLEDINLLAADKKLCIQVKAKEAEGKWWCPSDPILGKALFHFYRKQSPDRDDQATRLVFLSNRGFNASLARLKRAIHAGAVDQSQDADHLFTQLQRYVNRNHPKELPPSKPRFLRLLGRLSLIEFLPADSVAGLIQAKLQQLGVADWKQAFEHFYTTFSKLSVRKGGARIARQDLAASLQRFSEQLRLQVVPLALQQLCADIDDFTGRQDEVEQLTALLGEAGQTDRTAVVIADVAGMAGVGKSTLAIHVAHLLTGHFPDAQLYVDLRGVEDRPSAPHDVLARLMRALGLEDGSIPENADERAALYRSLMADRQVLLLLDNAHNESQVRPVLPGSSTCAVLVTSRETLSSLEGASFIELKVMRETEALELLRRTIGAERVQLELEAASKITELCGRLPLAIRIAGGKLRDRQHWSLESYASRLEDERGRLERLQLRDLSVRASFALSYQDLASDDARLFRLLGLLTEPSFPAGIAAVLMECEPDTVFDTLERLIDLRLLEPAGEARYRFHDLMRLFAREKLQEEEPSDQLRAASSRAERWYLTASGVHFYQQAAILDQYVHMPDPTADPEMQDAILQVLSARDDLQSYFFRRQPSAAWAPILWEHGFFSRPPTRRETDTGYAFPRWDVLEYLVDVAAQAPEVVVKVVDSIEAEGWYLSRAIRALSGIPADIAEVTVPRIVEWVGDTTIAKSIGSEVGGLVVHLASNERVESALELLRALTAPVPSANVRKANRLVFNAEAQSRFLNEYEVKAFFEQNLPLVAQLQPGPVSEALRVSLCAALALEADARERPEFQYESWWRVAIEDTEHDLDQAYKHQLLRALRDILEMWARKDPPMVQPTVLRYLTEECEILRRLAFHLLRRFPRGFRSIVVNELLRFENLSDGGIHHEFFLLLRNGFLQLDTAGQKALVSAILKGPPLARVGELARWAEKNTGETAEEYASGYIKIWIRDRLLMLEEGKLPDDAAAALAELTQELGAPKRPPEFGRGFSRSFWVRDMAPLTEEELSAMSPEQLVEFVRGWRPDPKQTLVPHEISYRGLANSVAKVLLKMPQRYETHVSPIALCHPEYAYAILTHLQQEEPMTPEVWEFGIQLCAILLADETARTDVARGLEFGWLGVRLAIVRFVERGLSNERDSLPAALLPRARDLLIVLIGDSNPGEETNQPPQTWPWDQDLLRVVLSTVRPRALAALIEYAHYMALDEPHTGQDVDPRRPEDEVRQTLTRKLDRRDDPSWAVHAVFGQRLNWLFWLDREWVERNIDRIFPEGEDDTSVGYSVAAWDSYVCSHRLWIPILEILRPKYVRAIYRVRDGQVTQTSPGPVKSLAIHIATEYLFSVYDPCRPAGPENLIALFYAYAPQEYWDNVPMAFWRVFQDASPAERETSWPRVRAIWELRARKASASDHSEEFEEEMGWFARLLPLVPASETAASLWPLLESLLPYVPGFGIGRWRAVESFLAVEVDRDPVRTIKLYRMMHQRATVPPWLRQEESRTILERAAADQTACPEALMLIGLIAERGDDQFRDLYMRHRGCLTGG